MKLLFDQNLSFKLVRLLEDVFPESQQVRSLQMDTAADSVIWDYAAKHEFTIVTLDVDYANLSLLRGHPPKVIWLRCGNQPTEVVERILRVNGSIISVFEQTASAACIELFR
jgi:predicted nuclease of predicted toxin-antitoxin system